MNIIQVKNLVKKYKKADKNSVDNISFNVKEGSFFAFLGENGAGKTTTISILTTTLAKTSGDIIINKRNIDKYPAKIRKDIGIIAQKPSLDENLTGEENIRIHSALYGVYSFRPTYSLMSEDYKQKVEELIDLIDMKDFLHKKVKTYSGGMKRKLEIIRSLIHEPKILFLDEPTTGLDPVSRKSIWEYLNNLRKETNLTIFLTTHYLEEAEQADQVAIINHGKIILNDTPEGIKKTLLNDYVILTTKYIDKLKKELQDKKINIIEDLSKENSVALDINKSWTVQKYIKMIDTEISDVSIIKPTLEEAYLKLLS